ncbi:MAG: DUF3843 family protein [Muribaculaceae bacterium]|nr:DUF3843 family protein [Muribaculaceae bacterium]
MLKFETFLLGQPCSPEETSTDRYYFDLTLKLINAAKDVAVADSHHEALIERAALCLIGYYQDMIADAGLWHGFTDECRRLYGTPVPFFAPTDDYIDYELNREDVGFIVWYAMAMYSDDRCIYPFRKDVVALADVWYGLLESEYENSPVPEGYHLAHELDVYAKEDQEMILRLGSWLYLHSWLLRPAFALTANELISEMISSGKGNEEIAEALQEAVKHQPTGPLALYLREWVHLTINHRLPSRRERQEEKDTHPSFVKLTEATGGEPVKFIEGYSDFNRFLIDSLGWKEGEEHLSQLKDCRDFALMVNPSKGLLVAPNVCRCIKSPLNPYYDNDYAAEHAIELLTERGACPHDLLAYVCENNWLPDAVFPGSSDHELVGHFHDFIARCYLQLYYRGD